MPILMVGRRGVSQWSVVTQWSVAQTLNPNPLVRRWLGVLLLLVMALARSVWSIKVVIVPLYLVRTACANCTSALARSILMDFVSKVRGCLLFCALCLPVVVAARGTDVAVSHCLLCNAKQRVFYSCDSAVVPFE